MRPQKLSRTHEAGCGVSRRSARPREWWAGALDEDGTTAGVLLPEVATHGLQRDACVVSDSRA
eukprot:2223187-Prymnesium_polylepis.1